MSNVAKAGLQLNLSNTDGVQTLSSIEVVRLINEERLYEYKSTGKEYKELQHKNFLAKVNEVIGESLAAKFLATNTYSSGKGVIQERKIYNFPQREACLMLMSYSYKLQAKVYDAWVVAEKKVEQLTAPKLPANYIEALESLVASEKEKVLLLETTKVQEAAMVQFGRDFLSLNDLEIFDVINL